MANQVPVLGRDVTGNPTVGTYPITGRVAVPARKWGIIPLSANDSTTNYFAQMAIALAEASAGGYDIAFEEGRYNFSGQASGTNQGMFTNITCGIVGVPGKTLLYLLNANGRNVRWAWANASNFQIRGVTFYVPGTGAAAANDAQEYDIVARLTFCSKFVVEDFVVGKSGITGYGAYGAGLLMRSCTDAYVIRTSFYDGRKDSLHVTGPSSNITIDGVLVENGGDDGVAVVGYQYTGTIGQPENINLRNITVRGIKRARCITFVGAKNCSLENFYVDGRIPAGYTPTAPYGDADGPGSGIYVTSERSFGTYGNENISISKGVIVNCGRLSLGALHLSTSGLGVTNNISLSDIEIRDSGRHAAYFSGSPSEVIQNLRLTRVRVINSADPNGVSGTAGTGSFNAYHFKGCSDVVMNECYSEKAGGSALYLEGVSITDYINTVSITNGGSGYVSAPTVSFTGGGGSGAVANAIISGGSVVGVFVTNAGSGYTSAPTVSFSGGGGANAAATATAAAQNNNSGQWKMDLTADNTGWSGAGGVDVIHVGPTIRARIDQKLRIRVQPTVGMGTPGFVDRIIEVDNFLAQSFSSLDFSCDTQLVKNFILFKPAQVVGSFNGSAQATNTSNYDVLNSGRSARIYLLENATPPVANSYLPIIPNRGYIDEGTSTSGATFVSINPNQRNGFIVLEPGEALRFGWNAGDTISLKYWETRDV